MTSYCWSGVKSLVVLRSQIHFKKMLFTTFLSQNLHLFTIKDLNIIISNLFGIYRQVDNNWIFNKNKSSTFSQVCSYLFESVTFFLCFPSVSHWCAKQCCVGLRHWTAELWEGSAAWLPVCVAPGQSCKPFWSPGREQEQRGTPGGGTFPLTTAPKMIGFNNQRADRPGCQLL